MLTFFIIRCQLWHTDVLQIVKCGTLMYCKVQRTPDVPSLLNFPGQTTWGPSIYRIQNQAVCKGLAQSGLGMPSLQSAPTRSWNTVVVVFNGISLCNMPIMWFPTQYKFSGSGWLPASYLVDVASHEEDMGHTSLEGFIDQWPSSRIFIVTIFMFVPCKTVLRHYFITPNWCTQL